MSKVQVIGPAISDPDDLAQVICALLDKGKMPTAETVLALCQCMAVLVLGQDQETDGGDAARIAAMTVVVTDLVAQGRAGGMDKANALAGDKPAPSMSVEEAMRCGAN